MKILAYLTHMLNIYHETNVHWVSTLPHAELGRKPPKGMWVDTLAHSQHSHTDIQLYSFMGHLSPADCLGPGTCRTLSICVDGTVKTDGDVGATLLLRYRLWGWGFLETWGAFSVRIVAHSG